MDWGTELNEVMSLTTLGWATSITDVAERRGSCWTVGAERKDSLILTRGLAGRLATRKTQTTHKHKARWGESVRV